MTDGYRIRSPETWALARDAYLAGAAAEAVCRRFDLGLTAFRTRAREQGWRRSDLDDPEPEPLDTARPDHTSPVWDPDDPEDDFADPDALRRVAADKMALAVRRGRVDEALRWARLDDLIARRARMEAREARERAREEERALHDESAQAQSSLRRITDNACAIGTQARAILETDRVSDLLSRMAEAHDPHDPHPAFHGAPTGHEDAPPEGSRAARRRAERLSRRGRSGP
ncbi:hypothetical protein [Brevundimonas sp.]|jgi:hypothetical protein|uniref:hypothetical protein n=1 Tax=Brevundimonas sp. TaxID=1871086 RepID=UPI003784BFF6